MTSIATTGTRGRVPVAEAHPCFCHALISGYLSWKTASVAVPRIPSPCTGGICSPELRQYFSVCAWLSLLDLGCSTREEGSPCLLVFPGAALSVGRGPGEPEFVMWTLGLQAGVCGH